MREHRLRPARHRQEEQEVPGVADRWQADRPCHSAAMATPQPVSDGEKNLEKLCDNVKATGITVITIAFALGNDTGTENRLKNCSTDPDKHFFEAEDSNDLTKAFEQIKNQIASAIYLSQ
jgi:hypothetical protein